MRRVPALAGLVLALAASGSLAQAGHLPVSPAGSADAMPGMQAHDNAGVHAPMADHPAMHVPATAHRHEDARQPSAPVGTMAHHSMENGPAAVPAHHQHTPVMPHPAPSPAGAMAHAMGPMQGGDPPPDARDPDYSDGVRAAPMHAVGMEMEDRPRYFSLQVDRLEAFQGRHGNGRQWEIEGGYGNNRDRLWLRTEGERSRGRLEAAHVELLWQHAVAAFWDAQLGVRTDTGEGPHRQWVAFGIQGLAPYWFKLEATGYVGTAGRTALRLRADYELLFTQRLVLQPELELDAYGKADPARGLGSGLSEASLGLRLRYEIRREVAPYVGLVWARRFGGTAEFARTRGEGRAERRWVAGLRFWF